MSEPKKVHVALNVNSVARSVEFYRAMFCVDPVKWKPGYAKFAIDAPPPNLTLNFCDNISLKARDGEIEAGYCFRRRGFDGERLSISSLTHVIAAMVEGNPRVVRPSKTT